MGRRTVSQKRWRSFGHHCSQVVTVMMLVTRVTVGVQQNEGYEKTGYGVDVSFPMHGFVKKGEIGHGRYEEFMRGCGEGGHLKKCESNERARMAMNRDQIPRQRNYTELGFGKLKAPEKAYRAARDFWDRYRMSPTEEAWPPGNTYVNNWVKPTKMVSFEDKRFQPAGLRAKDAIWAAVKPVLEAWTGQRLKPTSLYGVRSYQEGAILATHVDRLPLVTSAIINVDQNVSEPWPVEVVGHDGAAYNVELAPGDMALYESHTVLHGRPEPLRGDFFANCFVHFIPLDPADPSQNEPGIDFNWQSKSKKNSKLPKITDFPPPRPHHDALADAVAAARRHDADSQQKNNVPRPTTPSSSSSSNKKKKNKANKNNKKEEGHQVVDSEDFGKNAFMTGTVTALHVAAAQHNLPAVLEAVARSPDLVYVKDQNAWTPLHESARAGGDISVIEALVNSGSDIGARTVSGASALWIAKQYNHRDVARFLESLGAPEYPDEL